jgi:hypothetical protein
VQDYESVCRTVHKLLVPGGAFVFSVEHPIFTSRAEQDWWHGEKSERLHWPVDHYQAEGERRTSWLADDVVKYHRTIATYVNGVVDNGFRLMRVIEPMPSAEMVAGNVDMVDELRRPMFLLIAAEKGFD